MKQTSDPKGKITFCIFVFYNLLYYKCVIFLDGFFRGLHSVRIIFGGLFVIIFESWQPIERAALLIFGMSEYELKRTCMLLS